MLYYIFITELYEHTITCNSLSKTYSITGWRLGYLIGPEEVIEAAKKVHDFLTVGAAAPLQEAAVAGLNFPESYYEKLLETYTEKRNVFLEGLEFCEWMIQNIGVAAVPGSSFFKEEVNHLIRLHFAREKETIDEALARLEKMTALLKG